MYLKKVEGPRTVTLPDGSTMSRADLPKPGTQRWVASRKAAVVKAVASGLLPRDGALDLYEISEEELDEWERAILKFGERALKATSVQKYRQL